MRELAARLACGKNDPNQLRYFDGLSLEDAAEVVGLSRSSAYEHWAYARVRLRCLLQRE